MGVTITEAGPAPAGGPVPVGAAPAPMPPTPSETLVRAAVTTGTFTGPSGRTYAFKKLGPLDRMLVAKAIGGELMANSIYASYAMVAASVTNIAGEDVALPTSEKRVEARVQRIGEDWDLLNLTMAITFAPPREADDEGEDAEDGAED